MSRGAETQAHEQIRDGSTAPTERRVERSRIRRRISTLPDRAAPTAAVAVGGAAGALARYGLTFLLPHRSGSAHHPGGFPWPTFAANVVGCLLIGVLMVLILDVWVAHRLLRPFLGVGVLGGFTTFSTYSVETRSLLLNGQAPLGLVYLFGTLAAALVAVWLGAHATRLAVRVHPGRSR